MAREDLLKALERELKADEANFAELRSKYERRIVAMYRNFAAQLSNAIREPGVYRGEQIRIERAVKIIENLNTMLGDAGFSNIVVDYMEDLAALGNQALNYFKHFVSLDELIGLTGEDKAILRSLSQSYRKAIIRLVDQGLISPIEQAIQTGAAAGLTREQMVDNLLRTASGLTPTRLITLTSDTQRDFHQAVRVAQAEVLGMQIFLYQGPLDKIISEQCRFLSLQGRHGLANGWRKNEISASLHPNLKGNVLISRGHPNCRHNWRPITQDLAEEMGWRA